MKKALVPTNVKNAVLASFLGLFVVGVYYFSIKRMQGQVPVVDLSVLLTPIAVCVCIMRLQDPLAELFESDKEDESK